VLWICCNKGTTPNIVRCIVIQSCLHFDKTATCLLTIKNRWFYLFDLIPDYSQSILYIISYILCIIYYVLYIIYYILCIIYYIFILMIFWGSQIILRKQGAYHRMNSISFDSLCFWPSNSMDLLWFWNWNGWSWGLCEDLTLTQETHVDLGFETSALAIDWRLIQCREWRWSWLSVPRMQQ